jgi:hypothetical protein
VRILNVRKLSTFNLSTSTVNFQPSTFNLSTFQLGIFQPSTWNLPEWGTESLIDSRIRLYENLAIQGCCSRLVDEPGSRTRDAALASQQ